MVLCSNNKLLKGGSKNKKNLKGGMNLGFTVKDIIIIGSNAIIDAMFLNKGINFLYD